MKKFDPKEFGIGLLAGAAVAALVFWIGTGREYELLRGLTDSCFVPAVLLLGVSGLMLARNDGTFDAAGYSLKTVFFNHFPGFKGEDEDFLTYKEKKAAKRKSPINLFLAGLVYLVLSIILLIVYMNFK